jgi:hypothetical protein
VSIYARCGEVAHGSVQHLLGCGYAALGLKRWIDWPMPSRLRFRWHGSTAAARVANGR